MKKKSNTIRKKKYDKEQTIHYKKEIEILKTIIQTIAYSSNLHDILNKIINIVTRITRCDACFIYLLDARKKELVLRASKTYHPDKIGQIRLRVGEGIAGWVVQEKKLAFIPRNASSDSRFKYFDDLPEDSFQAILSTPIICNDEVVGAINVQHKNHHNYDGNTIDLIGIIANQVGGAIEKAKLSEEIERKTKEIETLARISKTIVSGQYLEDILNLIVTVTAEMMGSKICSIMLLDEKKNELEIKATQSLSREYRNKSNLKLGQSISGKVVQQKRPITVLDVTKEPGYTYPEIAKKEGLCSMLAVPMMLTDRVIGVINSYTSSEHGFTEDEIKILQAIANQAAVAVENTKLMQETITIQEALETRKLVEKAKGILMKETGLTEDDAYHLIHKKSMDARKTMKQTAEAIIFTNEMKKQIK